MSLDLDEKQILCDVEFSEDEAVESTVMKVFAKTMDTAVRQFILIVWPKISSAAGSLEQQLTPPGPQSVPWKGKLCRSAA